VARGSFYNKAKLDCFSMLFGLFVCEMNVFSNICGGPIYYTTCVFPIIGVLKWLFYDSVACSVGVPQEPVSSAFPQCLFRCSGGSAKCCQHLLNKRLSFFQSLICSCVLQFCFAVLLCTSVVLQLLSCMFCCAIAVSQSIFCNRCFAIVVLQLLFCTLLFCSCLFYKIAL
jgi:hypothetical protein